MVTARPPVDTKISITLRSPLPGRHPGFAAGEAKSS